MCQTAKPVTCRPCTPPGLQGLSFQYLELSKLPAKNECLNCRKALQTRESSRGQGLEVDSLMVGNDSWVE